MKKLLLILIVFISLGAVAQTVQVSVFNYPGLNGSVGSTACDVENANLISIVNAIPGYAVDGTITSFANSATLATQLDASTFFFMTDMESQSPSNTTFFPVASRAVFENWVSTGGVMVMTGTYGANDTDFLNLIFSWDLGTANGSSWAKNTANTAGTPFDAVTAPSLPNLSATDAISSGTVPNFTTMWGTDSNATVAVIKYGLGYVIYMGYDFYNTGTSCPGYGSDWVQQVIPAALEYATALSSSAVVNTTQTLVDFEYTFSESGTTSFILVPGGSTVPTVAEIVAGVNYTGGTVLDNLTVATTADVPYTFNLTGLLPATNYDIYVVTYYFDGSSNVYSGIETANFTTLDNDAPVGSAIANQLECKDGVIAPLALTITDAYPGDNTFIVTASSSNTSFVPNANIIITGTGASRSFAITPTTGALGSSTITVSIEDSLGVIGTQTFNVAYDDFTNPVITSTHSNLTIGAPLGGASLLDYTGSVVATDNCTSVGNLTITQSPIVGTNITGPTNTITLIVTDEKGNFSNVTFNLAVSNTLPFTVDDIPADIVENTGLINIDVLANDGFGGDGPNVGSIIVTPISGTIGSALLNDGGTVNDPTDDSIDFIPAFGYFGAVSIDYTITDSNGDSSTATVTFNVLAGEPIVCGPINTLYQTVGNTTPGKTDIFRYNNFQQSYIKVGELGGTATGSSAPNSAYSAATQYVYSNEPSDGGSVLRVYDPAASYSYVGSITITGNSVNFNNTLFAQGNFIGYVNNNRVVRFDVTNIAAYPATVAVNEVTIAGASGANDFTLIGDEIYGVRNTTLRIINLATNTLLDRTITFDESLDGVPNDGSFGAAWQDRNGNFYCFNNGNGGIYKITDVVNPASTIAVKVLLANPSGQNDGFGCELGPDPLDWDEDGISNNIDIDDDNDGILDVNESAGTGLDPGGDADGDGVFNFRDVDIAGYVDVNGDTVNDNFDFDLDGIPDAYDLDSDNDGIPDNIEAQPTTGYVAPSNSDGDSDGLDDAYDTDAVGGFAVSPPNTDGTGNPDFLDVDADDDGSYDTVEAGLVLANADIDFDGLDDAIDTDLTNPTDSNGTIDNPLTDLQDTYGSVERDYRETSDLDADGVDDVTDLDDDNDGILDTVEYPATLEPFGDEDGDGIYNYADAIDNGTGDGSLTDYTNTNADVIPDAYDFDLDGIVNHLDTDSDNDGCSDANEAYGSSTADAGDGMQFGTGDPLTLGESEVNANGTVVSAGYTLPVNLDASLGDTDFDYLQLSILPTIITLDPIDVTILTFSNVSFTSTAATSGTGTIEHYQWQVQVNGGITWADIVNDGVIYSGANTTTLDITILNNALDGNNYRLVISSPAFVCDTDVISAAALLTISQNDILAINDNGSGIEGTASTAVANILANDDLAGATPTTGTVILTEVSSTSVNVTLNTATGAVDVSAAATAGTYSIVYQICETANPTNCTTGEVTVTIADLGNPTAVDDNISITEDTTIATVISALSNDSLIDGASYSSGSFIYTGANGAIIVDNGDGTFDYTPAATFSGLDSFSYTICDNDIPVASCSTATVFVTVLDEGNPFSVNDIANTILNTTVITGNVLTNDTVIDNATITSFNVVSTNGGIVADNGGGTFSYTPPVGFIGIDTFTYTLCDDDTPASCSTATVIITVAAGSSDLVTGKIVSAPASGVDYVEGETVIYTVFVDNNGPNDATNVSLTDLLPIGVTYVSDDALGAYNSGSGIWTIGNIANGAAVFLNITATVDAGTAGTTITNFTTAATGDQSDPGPGVDDLSEPITVSNNADIVLTKVVTNSTPNVGDTVTYTVTVTNNGAAAVTNLVVTDALPAGLAYGLAIPTAGTWTSPNWSVGSLASGVTETIFIEAVVGAGTSGQVLTNTVTNTQDQTDDNTTPDDASESITVTSTDLVTTKTVSNTTPDEGDTIVYTVTVTNNGPSDATGVSLTDLLPAGVTYVSDDAAGAYNPGSGLWTIGGSAISPLVNGSFESGDFTGWTAIDNPVPYLAWGVRLLDNHFGPNTLPTDGGYLSSNGFDGNIGEAILYQDIAISGTTMLSWDENIDYSVGGLARIYEVQVRDLSNNVLEVLRQVTALGSDTDNVWNSFSADLSAYSGQTVRIAFWQNIPQNYSGPGKFALDNVVLNSTSTTIASGDSVTLNITATVNAGTSGDVITNFTTAAVGDQEDSTTVGDDLSESITVSNDADIVLMKVVNNATPNVGDTVTYTVTVTNNGPAAVTNLVVADALDAGLTFGLVTPSTGVWTAPNWTIGSLASGATETITIEAVVDAGTGGTTLVNTVSNTQDQTDDNTTPDDASESVTVTSSDLITTKVVNILTPDEGDGIVYTITVTNSGSDATGVSLTDNLPAGVTYVSDNGMGAYNSGSGIWTIGNLADGATATLNITATVNAGTGGQTITNVTTAATGDQTDPDATTDTLSADILVNIFSDIVLTKVVDNATPNTGDTVTYTVTVTNNGAAAVTNLVVTDALPAGLTFGSATPSAGTWTAPNWTIGSLARGASESITIEALVVAAGTIPSTTLTNTVSNTQDQIDTNVTLDDPTADIVVTASDLVTGKIVSAPLSGVDYVEGETVIYTVFVDNNGPNDATNVSLTDLLPIGVTYVSDDALGAYNSGSGIWTIGNIANGAAVFLNITATVDAGTAGTTITNFTTAATGDQSDPGPGVDDLSEPITVSNNADIVLTKVVTNSTPNVGDTVTYTVTVTNNGAAAVTNLVVTDALPAGLAYGLAIPTAGTWTSPNWAVGSLASGVTETIFIEAVVGAGTGGQVLTNTVTNTQDQTDDNTTPDDASETITVTSTDLVTTKTVSNTTPDEGDTIVYTVTVTNNGPSDATGVSLTDLLPAGVTYVSDDAAGAYNPGSGLWTIGGSAISPLVNGSFESGDFTGWTAIDNPNPLLPYGVYSSNDAGGNLAPTVPSDGILLAGNGFDGDNGEAILYQDITVSGTTTLSWDENIDYQLIGNGAVVDRIYEVQVRDLSNNVLEVLRQVIAIAGTDELDNNWNSFSADLSAYAGQNVRIAFWQNIPQNWTGPAKFSLDNVVLNTTSTTIASGDSVTLNITATVNAGTSGDVITNFTTAAVGDQEDSTTVGDDLSESITVANDADIVLTKVVDNNSPNEGDTVTYTVTVTNNGPAAVTNLVVADALDAGLTFGLVTPSTGVWTAPNWTIGSLASGATETLTIQATVDAGTGGATLTNTVSNTQDQDDDNTTSDDASESVTVTSSDLVTTKVVDNATPNEGDTIVYTIEVTNSGSDATGVSLTDNLPAGVTYVSDDAAGAYNSGSGIWSIGAIADGVTATLNITATVNAGTSNTTITNFTTAANGDQSDPTTVGDDLSESITVANDADIVLTKVVDNNSPNEGETITYTVTVTNNGPATVTNLVVADALDAGLTFGLATPSTGVWTAPNWTIGSLASGATETITIEAVVGVGTGGTTLVNTVSNTQDQTDDNTTPDDASESVTVTSSDLVTIKVVNILTPDEGDGIVYTITVSNTGSDATGVSLTDNLPAGVTYVSDDSAGAYNSGSGIWTIGAIADGATATLNITATVNAGTSGQTITNVTTAATGDQTDPDATTDTLSADILVNIFSDIVLTKVVDNATPNTGDTVTYTVTVTNNGAAAVTNLVVTDALPAGLTFGSATPSAGTWSSPNWTIGNLARGASESITIEALVVAAGTIPSITLTNIVTNTQDQIDTNVTLDDSTADIVVTASDLVTTKVVDNATPNEGDMIVYTIEVTNTGSDATNVSLTDNLPAGVTYVSDDSLGAYNSGSGIWTIGAIANGATATLNITATVNAGTSGDVITNFTTAAMGDQSDPTTDGDDLSELITVANNADIVLTKVVDNNSPNEGDTITYTVTVTNNGPAAVTNLVIADALDAGLTFGLVTPSTGTWSSPNWTIGSLATGATETITIEAVVGVGTGGTTLTNTVSNTQDQTDDNTTPDDASESVTVTSSDLETLKTVSDASPNEGNIITYTITVTNNGLSDATSVSLVDNLPVGVTYVSHSTSDGVFNNGSGVWSIGSLAYGDTATLTIDASVDAGTVGVTITNTTSAVIADQSDPNISNNIGSVSIVPVAFIDLSLTKTIVNNITAPLVGDQITFEIRVNNEGPTDASGVQVTDLIPSGYEFVNYSSTIGGYDPISGVWHIGNVEIGNMAVLLVDVIVLESGDYTNCAEITAANEDDVDSTPNSGNDGEDDYACALTVPVNEADLSITKTVVANNVTPLVDTEVTFEIRITNNGPLDATEVIVTDMLPDGYTFVNYSSTIGTYSEVSGLWTIGTILNGETEVLLIDVIVNATGEYENCTSITNLRQIDPNPSNDSDCASTTPISVADLELTKDVDNLLPYAETNVDFTIVVTNNGPSEATGVVVTDLLPSGYTFVSYSATAGTYDAGSGLWNIGSVINGESVTLTVTAYVLPIGDWTNVAEVTAANELDLDSTPGNNDIYEDDQAQVTTAPIILLTMPEGFSPDGDGINDVFEIEFLEVLYPNFSMQIVNRYGNKVYEYQHNGNPNTTPLWWDGFSNGRWNLDSLELPTGTYFYTIYFNNDERKPQTGWIYLRR